MAYSNRVGGIENFSRTWYELEDGQMHIVYISSRMLPEITACGKRLMYPDEHMSLTSTIHCEECERFDWMRELSE